MIEQMNGFFQELYRAKPDDTEQMVMDAWRILERIRKRDLRHFLGNLEDMRDTLNDLIRSAKNGNS